MRKVHLCAPTEERRVTVFFLSNNFYNMNVHDGKFVYAKSDQLVYDDFIKLQNMKPDDMIEKHTNWEVRTGCPTPQKIYLFRSMRAGQLLSERMHWSHRVKTSTVWSRSGQEVLDRWKRDPSFLRNASARIDKATRNRKFTKNELIYDTIRTNSALMTLTHFRATVSKYLCDTTDARVVLDFSAGWGDRLTGFMASPSVTDIHLVDPRPGSMNACRTQHEFIGSTKNLTLHQGPAEVVLPRMSSNTYDLIVSSPPYFDLENYGETTLEERGQIRLTVNNVSEYINVFLRPVLIHCARLLKRGGILAVNLDDNVRLGTYVCKPALEIAKGIPSLSFLGTAGLRKGSGFGASVKNNTKSKAEPIYMWKKV